SATSCRRCGTTSCGPSFSSRHGSCSACRASSSSSCAASAGVASARCPGDVGHPALVPHLERREEGGLRDLDLAELAHALLALLLLVQELALARDVAAVALGGHVLAQGRDGLARDDAPPDRRLDRDLEELPRDELLEALAEQAAALLGAAPVHDDGERVHGLAVHQDGELDEVALAVALDVIVEAG